MLLPQWIPLSIANHPIFFIDIDQNKQVKPLSGVDPGISKGRAHPVNLLKLQIATKLVWLSVCFAVFGPEINISKVPLWEHFQKP